MFNWGTFGAASRPSFLQFAEERLAYFNQNLPKTPFAVVFDAKYFKFLSTKTPPKMSKKTNPMTDLPTACRFSVLEVSDDSEDEETKASKKNDAKNTTSSSTASSTPAAAKKKRNKKRRHRTKNTQGNDTEMVTSSNENPPNTNTEENGWETWQNRDEQFILEQFQKDLQAALEASKIVDHPTSQQPVNNDLSLTRKKKKEKTVSLDEFISGSDVRDHAETNGTLSLTEFDNSPSLTGLDTFQLQDSQGVMPSGLTTAEKPAKTKSKKKTHEKLEDLESGSKPEMKKVIPASHEESIKAEMVHVQEELSKKDEIVTKLQKTIEKQKTWISDLQKELIQVKKRNKQLCHILAQGEMKEKADLLVQIEELNEFREQVVELHAELEQERSKSSALKQELIKHQASHSRGRHGSSS